MIGITKIIGFIKIRYKKFLLNNHLQQKNYMVLSLGFILAFIGAAVALLIGILIFSEVSDAIICPASSGGDSDLFNTLQENFDSTQTLGFNADWVGQRFSTTGESITSVTITSMNQNSGTGGTIVSQIYTGATTDIDGSTLVANSSNILALSGSESNLNFTWFYIPAVQVSDSDTYVSILLENFDSDIFLRTSSVDVSPGVGLSHDNIVTAGFLSASGDILMQVTIEGGGIVGGQGSEECENAKDTAWTVIGILPVALFFALFAIFGALGRTS